MALEIPPRHKINCGVAANLMDASAELAKLNEQFGDLKWRVLRGEPDYFKDLLPGIRLTVRKLAKALESAEYDVNHPSEEVKKD